MGTSLHVGHRSQIFDKIRIWVPLSFDCCCANCKRISVLINILHNPKKTFLCPQQPVVDHSIWFFFSNRDHNKVPSWNILILLCYELQKAYTENAYIWMSTEPACQHNNIFLSIGNAICYNKNVCILSQNVQAINDRPLVVNHFPSIGQFWLPKEAYFTGLY